MIDVSILGWVKMIIAAAAGFFVVYRSIPLLIKVAFVKNLYDKPDGERKVHTDYITNLGGIALYLAIMTAFLFSGVANQMQGLSYFAGATFILFFTGLKDDLIGLSPKIKLIVELVACSALVWGMGLSITHFGGVLGLEQVPFWVGIPITFFTVIVVVNAYNLIDGIDGLAGGVAAIAGATLSFGFFMAGDIVFGVLGMLMAVVAIGYLFHNFHPANIFMGDTGSLVFGFILAVMAVRFISLAGAHSFDAFFGNSSVIIPIAALSIPLYDTISVFGRRMMRGQSPFTAVADHVHHTLLRVGWGQKHTVLYLYSVTIFIVVLSYLSSGLNVNFNLV